MVKISNEEVIETLNTIADLLEIKGENPFKIRAYRQASASVENTYTELSELLASPQGLSEVEGFGEAITKKVTELLLTGKMTYLQELEQEVPASLLVIKSLHGVGPKTAAMLWHQLNVTTLEELEVALKAGKLQGLPKMGEKTIANISNSVQERLAQGVHQRRPRDEVESLVKTLLAQLRALKFVTKAEVAGSFRRGSPTVGDLDLLVCTSEPVSVLNAFATFPQVDEIFAQGDTKCSVVIDNLQIDCRAVSSEQFGAAWQYFTGSKEHNIKVRSKALKLGLTLNEYMVSRLNDGSRVAGSTEEEVYQAVGMNWVPPTERLGGMEIEQYSIR